MNNLSLVKEIDTNEEINKNEAIHLVTDKKNTNKVTHSKKNVIFSLVPEKTYGEVIKKIASSFWYVFEDSKVNLIAEGMMDNTDIWALAVVDAELNYKGIILRRDLFDMLGKQFGRDLHFKKSVKELCHAAVTFNHNKNIFSVANDIVSTFNQHSNTYYALTDGNKFNGIFSSKDMLIYLSEITQKDLHLAKKLQSCLVKETEDVKTDKCHIIGASYMAKGLGGDFYMIRKFSESKWTLNICDVSGKGISAALISTVLGAMTSMYNPEAGMKNFLINLNSFIFNTFESEKFITGIFLEFNEVTGDVILYDLGHSYGYVLRGNRMLHIKSNSENLPIGVKESLMPKSVKFKLEKGDLLMLYTDGFEEQKNPFGQEYGSTRLFNLVKRNRPHGINAIKDDLMADIKEFRDEYPQQDDISLILLEYTGV